jgi:hypothetical protein
LPIFRRKCFSYTIPLGVDESDIAHVEARIVSLPYFATQCNDWRSGEREAEAKANFEAVEILLSQHPLENFLPTLALPLTLVENSTSKAASLLR